VKSLFCTDYCKQVHANKVTPSIIPLRQSHEEYTQLAQKIGYFPRVLVGLHAVFPSVQKERSYQAMKSTQV
jgi:hypothetical protein